MNSLIFSVIIPLYNKEKFIARTLDSVLAQQTMTDYEVVLVDDGSRDNSGEVVKSYSDSRIRYIVKPNGGVSSARNRGIKEAHGEWLIFLDADDEMLPNALSVFDRLRTQNTQATVLVGGFVKRNDSGVELGRTADCGDNFTRCPYFMHWLRRFYPRPGATAIRRDVVERYGGFDEQMSFFEDYEFALRTMADCKVAYTGEIVNVYNVGDTGLSHSTHPHNREMSYYIPEMKINNIFWRALVYENLEYTLQWWNKGTEEYEYYFNLKETHFSRFYAAIHWVRQQMVRHHWI